jgi:hypothetical protein
VYNLVSFSSHDCIVVQAWVLQFGVSGSPKVYYPGRSRASIQSSWNTVFFRCLLRNRYDTCKTNSIQACNQTLELFINFVDNSEILDDKGFAPFGMISEEQMKLVDKFIYSGYGEL